MGCGWRCVEFLGSKSRFLMLVLLKANEMFVDKTQKNNRSQLELISSSSSSRLCIQMGRH